MNSNKKKDPKIKADFHIHSNFSADSNSDIYEIAKVATEKKISKIAITDHNEIAGALRLKEKFPKLVITGEEILSQEGEVIGLFINKKIKPYLSLEKTIHEIKNQGGLVYVPHPFDSFRRGLGKHMRKIIKQIDIIEVFNGKIFLDHKNKKALEFAERNNLAKTAGSDAHTLNEISSVYVKMKDFSNQKELLENLKNAEIHKKRQKLGSVVQSFYVCGKNKFLHGRSVR